MSTKTKRHRQRKHIDKSDPDLPELPVSNIVNDNVDNTTNDNTTNFEQFIFDQAFDMIVKIAMEKLDAASIDPKNITEFTARIMHIVEEFPMKGSDKKKIVLEILKKFTDKKIEISDLSDHTNVQTIDQLKFIINEVIPFTIDTLCAVSKHQLVIKTVTKTKSFFTSLCCGGKTT